MRVPGFASDEIRPLRKRVIPASHLTKVHAVNAARAHAAAAAANSKDP